MKKIIISLVVALCPLALVAQQNKVKTDTQTLVQTVNDSKSDLLAAGSTLQTLGVQAATSGGNSTTISLPQISNISQAFTKTQTIIAQTTTLLGDLQTLTQQLSVQQTQLRAGVSALNNGVNQLTPNAITAFNGYNSVRFANNQLLAGSASLTNGLSEAKSGSQKLANGASLLESRSGALIDGTSQLASGADTLANKLADAAKDL